MRPSQTRYGAGVGDSFQVIADVDATEAEAGALAQTVIRWMVDEEIIVAETSNCILGAPGHAPGPRYVAATEVDEPPRLKPDGVQVCVGRNVFHPSQGELGPVVCPRCGHTVVLEGPDGGVTEYWKAFSGALDAWYAGGSSDVPCAYCGQLVSFNDWEWVGEWPFAVGYLGFMFWNWPRLRATFITEVGQRLGHRLVVTKGKV